MLTWVVVVVPSSTSLESLWLKDDPAPSREASAPLPFDQHSSALRRDRMRRPFNGSLGFLRRSIGANGYLKGMLLRGRDGRLSLQSTLV
jgi:hypothetical protein